MNKKPNRIRIYRITALVIVILLILIACTKEEAPIAEEKTKEITVNKEYVKKRTAKELEDETINNEIKENNKNKEETQPNEGETTENKDENEDSITNEDEILENADTENEKEENNDKYSEKRPEEQQKTGNNLIAERTDYPEHINELLALRKDMIEQKTKIQNRIMEDPNIKTEDKMDMIIIEFKDVERPYVDQAYDILFEYVDTPEMRSHIDTIIKENGYIRIDNTTLDIVLVYYPMGEKAQETIKKLENKDYKIKFDKMSGDLYIFDKDFTDYDYFFDKELLSREDFNEEGILKNFDDYLQATPLIPTKGDKK